MKLYIVMFKDACEWEAQEWLGGVFSTEEKAQAYMEAYINDDDDDDVEGYITTRTLDDDEL